MRSCLDGLVSKHFSEVSTPPQTRCVHAQTSAALPQGPIHLVIASLDNSTWGRARHMGRGGPPPLRNRRHPWGIPSVTGTGRELLETANEQLRATFGTLEAAMATSPSCVTIFVHPEDLGEARLGAPASPWNMEEVRRWANKRAMHRKATFQCEFGSEEAAYPTGILISEPLNSRRIHRGWPHVRGSDGRYVGPLAPRCRCHNQHPPADRLRPSPGDKSTLRPGFTQWLLWRLLRSGLLRTGGRTANFQRTKAQPSYETYSDSAGSQSDGITDLASSTDSEEEQNIQATISDDHGLDIPFMRITGLLPHAEQAKVLAPSPRCSPAFIADQAAVIGAGTAHFFADSDIHPPAHFEDGEDATPRTSPYTSSPSPTSRAQDLREDKMLDQAPWCS